MAELHMTLDQVNDLTRSQYYELLSFLVRRSEDADPDRKNRQRVSTPEEARAAIKKLREEGFIDG